MPNAYSNGTGLAVPTRSCSCPARRGSPTPSPAATRSSRARSATGRTSSIVTSPLGIVPRECRLCYPAAHYDVPVTGYWDAEEVAVIAGSLAAYLERHGFSRVIAHLEGGALRVAEVAAGQVGCEIEPTVVEGRPTSDASLALLDAALDGSRRQREDPLRGLALYQFDCESDVRGAPEPRALSERPVPPRPQPRLRDRRGVGPAPPDLRGLGPPRRRLPRRDRRLRPPGRRPRPRRARRGPADPPRRRGSRGRPVRVRDRARGHVRRGDAPVDARGRGQKA